MANDPFWKPMADTRDRYRAALEEIRDTSSDPESKLIALRALQSPIFTKHAERLKRKARQQLQAALENSRKADNT